MKIPAYISPEAKELLSLLRDEYRTRIANGESATEAKAFGGGYQLKEQFRLEYTIKDIGEYCRELGKTQLISAAFSSYGKQLIGVYLSHRGIEYLDDIDKQIE